MGPGCLTTLKPIDLRQPSPRTEHSQKSVMIHSLRPYSLDIFPEGQRQVDHPPQCTQTLISLPPSLPDSRCQPASTDSCNHLPPPAAECLACRHQAPRTHLAAAYVGS
mmetsp:Transcript_4114/g.12618  ORF Transcript_4114/g.12618 Transcript_4114/m.12618 type:complete len:108 (+) Transcript_4114:58-381(+)